MKTLPLALFCLLLFHRLPAQEQPFVEVVASDTIVLSATRFVYSVILYPWDTGDNYGAGNGDPILTAEKLQELARQFGAGTPVASTSAVTVTPQAEQEPQVFPLYFDSPARLPALAEQLRRYVNVSANLSEINDTPETSFDERLTAKVLTKAKLKAQHLARQLGARLGPPLQLIEVMDQEQDGATWNLSNALGWTAYPALSALPGVLGSDIPPSQQGLVRHKTLRIRYALLVE